ncbi:hypothetical protein LPJ53_005888 [Coemansia erecta]|uniref:Methyltransferase domain-containing protein n=1 Tax=Coemansia erecta TaxID=147472 RepID=A0A9W8CPB0_9FUNG|nr:hypothetical protein LPJ53_005888 [Coemansia erecta]
MSHKSNAVERIVGKQYAGIKLRNYLVREFKDVLVVRAEMIAALRQKRVFVNGENTLDSHQLELGDCIRVDIDPLHTIRRRLQTLDLEMRYSEPGMVVLLKAPGINLPDIEWAAPALQIVARADSEMSDTEPDTEVKPWFAVNRVEKGVRSLVIVVDSADKQGAMLKYINSGRVLFRICALCHGSVDQRAVDESTTQSMKEAASKVVQPDPHQQQQQLVEDIPCMFDYDLWLQYNRLPPIVFDHIQVRVSKVTRSSTVGHLSLVEGTVAYAVNSSLVLRRYMYEMGYPIVGTQNHSRPLPNHRDKGALLAFVGITMPSLARSGESVVVSADIPPKLLSVYEREAKFYGQRRQKERDELRKIESAITSPDPSVESTACGTPAAEIELVGGVPAAYISGMKQFCGHVFHVTPDTLIPRPSTQTLVDAAISLIDRPSVRIMDLGTGTGCILMSILLRTPGARGVGIDISSAALGVAEQNRLLHSLEGRCALLKGSFESFATDADVLCHGPFDIIVCNPPYISAKKALGMRSVIEHEPSLALIADEGGYKAYSDIHASLCSNPSILQEGGHVAFEIGKGMERNVRRIFSDWSEVASHKDAYGFLRVLVFQRPK